MRTVRTVHKERRKTRNRFYGCSIIQLDRRRTTHSCSEARPSASSIKSCLPLTECKIEFYFATELFRVYFSFLSKKKGEGKRKKEEKEMWLSRVSVILYRTRICKYEGEKYGEKRRSALRGASLNMMEAQRLPMLTHHVCRDDGSWPRSWQR